MNLILKIPESLQTRLGTGNASDILGILHRIGPAAGQSYRVEQTLQPVLAATQRKLAETESKLVTAVRERDEFKGRLSRLCRRH